VTEEESAGGVIKLSSIIALDTSDGTTKLRGHVCEEVGECEEGEKLMAQQKSSQVMSAIIKNNQVVVISRDIENKRCPNVTVDQIKSSYNP
jgi:hypothetical protein